MIFLGTFGLRGGGSSGRIAATYLLPDSGTLRTFMSDGRTTDTPVAAYGDTIPDLVRLIWGSGTLKATADSPLAPLRSALEALGAGPGSDYIVAPGWFAMNETRDATGADFGPVGAHAIDLSGLDLSGVNFRGADFRGAKLQGCSFRYTVLTEAQFDGDALHGVDCSHATIANTVINGMDLGGTDFTGATFSRGGFVECNLGGAKFDRAVFTDWNFIGRGLLISTSFREARGTTSFTDCVMMNCDFTGARLPNVEFKSLTLTGARFNGAVLNGSRWRDCEFKNVDFGGATLAGADFTGASLTAGNVKPNPPKFGSSPATRTRFNNATLHTAFLGLDWSYCDFTNAKIDFAADFQGRELNAAFAVLPRVNFAGKVLREANFQSAVLHGASFANCDLDSAVFTDALLNRSGEWTGADFTSARLGLADFSRADLTGVTLTSAFLKGAKFRNTLMQLTDFANAFLAEVDFTAIRDRRMSGVSFVNACLVSAVFRETAFSSYDAKASNFSKSILLGADFTGASLADSILSNAKLSSAGGTIVAILPPRGASTEPKRMTLTYKATVLPPALTGPQTRCPDGNSGPCDARRLDTGTPPKEWLQP
ncbi:MAG TPA: pentapeptide repeat-containing protein [Thermoanaerobaculia bacterium]|nr:pentapeptide repeat-containing protein [Thermoanaerobaculia bacterium]